MDLFLFNVQDNDISTYTLYLTAYGLIVLYEDVSMGTSNV